MNKETEELARELFDTVRKFSEHANKIHPRGVVLDALTKLGIRAREAVEKVAEAEARQEIQLLHNNAADEAKADDASRNTKLGGWPGKND